MVLRLSVLLYILPPVLFAWYLQANHHLSRRAYYSSVFSKLTRHFSSSSVEERQPLLLNKEDPFSYDWQRMFQEQQQRGYYSKMMTNDNTFSQPPSTEVHVIVLIHGWLGNPLEMDSIKESLIKTIENENASSQTFVVHAATCNDGKTTDGIVAGGTRLAQEINSLLQFVVRDNPQADHITLSLCGNSLGGLYARQALADIEWTVSASDTNENSDENKVASDAAAATTTITPLLFVTTATPHLGVSQHTYIRLPRAVEYPIAQILDQTGRDLFRFSNVLEELTYGDAYIRPLQQFQQRLAYANVYGTDFQVPTPTAAFWAMDSDSPHEVVAIAIDGNDKEALPPSTIVLTLTTPQRPPPPNQYNLQHSEKDPTKRFQEWSQQLDRLGWTKVLVDVREHVPQVSMWTSSSSSSSSSNSDDDEPDDTTKSTWSHKSSWTAHELLKEFGSSGLLAAMGMGGKMRIPLGHTVMVANAKDKLNKWLTLGGKPVMDWLALSMVRTLQRASVTAPKVGEKKQET